MNDTMRELLFNGVEGAISMAITGTTKKGIECVSSYAVKNIIGKELPSLKPEYEAAISRTIKIAATVAGKKLADAYANDIVSVVKGVYYGYTAGRNMYKMAEGLDNSGSESEVLAGGSKEE